MEPRRLFRSFGSELAALAVAAMVVRLSALQAWYRGRDLAHDAPEYVSVGSHVVGGGGWTDPFLLAYGGVTRQTANHPPLASIWVALGRPFSIATADGWRIWMAVLGSLGVVLVGYLGREWAGRRVGLVAAAVAAISPAFWQQDLMVMAETGAQMGTALVLWLALRYRRLGRAIDAGLLGGAIALASLARSELILFLPFLLVPIVLTRARPNWALVATHLGAAGLWLVVGLAPWVGWNLVRFERPVTFTTGTDLTIAQTNCPLAYYGGGTGRWNLMCASETLLGGDRLDDESVLAAANRKAGFSYLRQEKGRVPIVMAARLGRTFGWYHPIKQVEVEEFEGQPPGVPMLALAVYGASLLGAGAGWVLAGRRALVRWPLLVPVPVVALAVAISRGGTRFRAPVEVPLAVLGALALVEVARWGISRWKPSASPIGRSTGGSVARGKG